MEICDHPLGIKISLPSLLIAVDGNDESYCGYVSWSTLDNHSRADAFPSNLLFARRDNDFSLEFLPISLSAYEGRKKYRILIVIIDENRE